MPAQFSYEYTDEPGTTRVRLYIDGVLVGSLDDTTSPIVLLYNEQGPLLFGRNYVDFTGDDMNYWGPYAGLPDDMRIYNAALTDAQVAGLYSSY